MSLLNQREAEIMTYKAQGLTSKQIAKLLNLEYRTIDSCFGKIKKKLRAKNTAHAIYLAFQGRKRHS